MQYIKLIHNLILSLFSNGALFCWTRLPSAEIQLVDGPSSVSVLLEECTKWH